MNKPIGIVIATHIEAGPVIRALGLKSSGDNLYQGSYGGYQIMLRVSGVGMEPARQAGFKLVEEGAGMLVSAGFCGALTENLKVGDVVRERIVSVRTAARTRAERNALTVRANAIAVDMETQAVIESGTRRGVPIRVVRVVSDLIDDDLTPLLGRSAKFSPLGIGLRLLNPMVWPLAKKLSANSKIAKTNLVHALKAFITTEAATVR